MVEQVEFLQFPELWEKELDADSNLHSYDTKYNVDGGNLVDEAADWLYGAIQGGLVYVEQNKKCYCGGCNMCNGECNGGCAFCNDTCGGFECIYSGECDCDACEKLEVLDDIIDNIQDDCDCDGDGILIGGVLIGGFDMLYPLKKAFQTIANNYRKKFCNGKARNLRLGEYHYGCHNFTGPGTKIDDPNVLNYKPYNDVDACSKQHDLDYNVTKGLARKDKERLIRKADEEVIECYNKYPNEDGYAVSKAGINSKMYTENQLPALMKKLTGQYFGKK